MFEKSRLAKAIATDDRDGVDRILKRHPDLLNQLLDDRTRPLSIAISHGHVDMAAHLVAQGADVSEIGSHGPNMLFDALHHEQLELAKAWAQDNPALLLKRDTYGSGLLHLAAARRNQISALTWLLGEGLDVEALDWRGRTPLQVAEAFANEQAVAALRPYQEKANLQHKRRAQKLAIREEGDEKWTKLDDDRIAHVRHEPDIGYRITAIFNFATGERTRLYRNIETDHESVETTSFDIYNASADVQAALARLRPEGALLQAAPPAAILKRIK